jgi:hypothetical protein
VVPSRILRWCQVGATVLAGSLSVFACSVVVWSPVLSPEGAQITVVRDGKPVVGAEAELHMAGLWEAVPLPYWNSVTAAEGIITLPYLLPGNYELRVSSTHAGESVLYFQVLGGAYQNVRSFVFEMSPKPPRSAQTIAAVAPLRAWLERFAGTIQDRTGAVIPKTKVSIKKRDDLEAQQVAEIQTDEGGNFSATLPPGEYVAFFEKRGFAIEILPFQIGKSGEQSFVLRLRLSACSERYSTKGELIPQGSL